MRLLIVAVILLAGVVAGLKTNAALVAHCGALFDALDFSVIGIFLVEIALTIGAYGRHPLDYSRDGWNVFDFLIVLLCLLPVGGQLVTVRRLARALRLLRLVTALPKLHLLAGALLKGLSAMGYVSLLLSLLFYIYAVTGVHLFGQPEADFRSIPTAPLTLFRIVTLDNWGDILNRATEHAPIFKVTIYFIAFIIIGTMIILNLFIGVILNSMSWMRAEIEERDRQQHRRGDGQAMLNDEFRALKQQLQSLQERAQHLRVTASLARPRGNAKFTTPEESQRKNNCSYTQGVESNEQTTHHSINRRHHPAISKHIHRTLA